MKSQKRREARSNHAAGTACQKSLAEFAARRRQRDSDHFLSGRTPGWSLLGLLQNSFLQQPPIFLCVLCLALSFLLYGAEFVHANLNAVCSLHAFYPTACVSTHAVVLCDMNGRQMPLSPAPTSSSVPLGLIRRGYVSHRYIGPSVTP